MLRLLLAVVMTLAGGPMQGAERPRGPVDAAQCVSCHAGFQPALVEDWRASGHGVSKVSCASCHGPAHDGGVRARRGAICIDCHGGEKAPAVHSHASSKHGVIVKLEGAGWDWTQPLRAANYRAPDCAYCHLYAGGHDTRRLLTKAGDPVASGSARDAARAVCYDCHAPRYVARQEDAGVRMQEIAWMKWREAEALLRDARTVHPEAELAEAMRLLARMEAHVTNVRLGVAHQSPDYQWWHGQPALDGDLLRIKGELSRIQRPGQDTGAGMIAPPRTSTTGN
jgi:hypothetical protein